MREPFRSNELLLGISEEAYKQIEKQIEIFGASEKKNHRVESARAPTAELASQNSFPIA